MNEKQKQKLDGYVDNIVTDSDYMVRRVTQYVEQSKETYKRRFLYEIKCILMYLLEHDQVRDVFPDGDILPEHTVQDFLQLHVVPDSVDPECLSSDREIKTYFDVFDTHLKNNYDAFVMLALRKVVKFMCGGEWLDFELEYVLPILRNRADEIIEKTPVCNFFTAKSAFEYVGINDILLTDILNKPELTKKGGKHKKRAKNKKNKKPKHVKTYEHLQPYIDYIDYNTEELINRINQGVNEEKERIQDEILDTICDIIGELREHNYPVSQKMTVNDFFQYPAQDECIPEECKYPDMPLDTYGDAINNMLICKEDFLMSDIIYELIKEKFSVKLTQDEVDYIHRASGSGIDEAYEKTDLLDLDSVQALGAAFHSGDMLLEDILEKSKEKYE